MMKSNRSVILVADDNDDLRALIVRRLSRFEYTMIEATNGEEAVKATLSVVPDLILMDLQMPVMDGLNAARHIRERAESQNVPIIFLSAYGIEGIGLFVKIDTLGKAPIEYLVKPFDIDQLISLVKSLLAADKES